MNARRKLTLSETKKLLLLVMVDFDIFCKEHKLDYYMIGGTLLGAIRHNGFIPWDDDIDVGMIRPIYEKFVSVMGEFNSKYEIKNYRIAKHCDYVITRIYIPNTIIDNPSLRKSKLDKRLYFDIFPLDYAPDDEKKQNQQRNQLMRYKTLLSLADYKVYNTRVDKVIARKAISILLRPCRSYILQRMESIMRCYEETHHICSMASQYDYKKQLFRKEIYGTPVKLMFEGHAFLGPECSHEYLKQLYGEDYMQLPPVEKRRGGFDIYLEE